MNYQGEDTNKTRPDRATKYMYGLKTDHYFKRHYKAYQNNLNSN